MAVETTQVLVEVSAVDESLLAVLAEVRPVVDVHAHVSPQLRVVRERLAAVRAQERPIARVLQHVQPQFARAVPDLAADCAAERPVVQVVQLDVFAQVGDRRKLLIVFPTLEPAFSCVKQHPLSNSFVHSLLPCTTTVCCQQFPEQVLVNKYQRNPAPRPISR